MAPEGDTRFDPETSESWLDLARSLVVAYASRRRAVGLDLASEASDAPVVRRDTGAGAAITAEVISEVRRRFHDSMSVPSPFSITVGNAELGPTAAEVLALALGCEVDPGVARLLAGAGDERFGGRLTLGDVVEIFAGDAPAAVASLGWDGSLRRAALVEVTEEGPFVQHQVGVHPALVWAMLGDRSVDPDLPVDADHVTCDPGGAPGEPVGDPADGHPLVVVTGADRMLRRSHAARRCLGDRFLAVRAPTADAGWAAMVRDATLTGRGIIVEVDDRLPEVGRRWVERASHLAWAISSATDPAISDLPRRTWTEVSVGPHEVTDAEWRAALGDTPRTHRLTHEQLESVRRVFPAVDGDLDTAVRRLVSGRMEHLARRIRPTRGWDDIVLSPDRLELLRSLVERYRYADRVYDEWGFSATPSRGLVALFSGPSGTGKTMATEIIAGVLGLDVFKLDLSAVVSKYIGETEKNLEQIFDAASAGNLVLFFDEADSLFGKRSEVRDARDRYANIEVSYLLQRLERYDGLVVLATNFEKNVDEAFIRRIHVRIEFTLPGVDERRAIWASNFPAGAPLEDVDLDWLARQFEISGGAIRNAAVHAGFLAAAAGTPITMPIAVRGVARELRKMGRLLKPHEFGDHFDAVVGNGSSGPGAAGVDSPTDTVAPGTSGPNPPRRRSG